MKYTRLAGLLLLVGLVVTVAPALADQKVDISTVITKADAEKILAQM